MVVIYKHGLTDTILDPYLYEIQVDFVEVTKPDPNDHKDGDLSAMNTGMSRMRNAFFPCIRAPP
jgi:hypothetical protein